MNSTRAALAITGTFFVVSIGYILLSDWLVLQHTTSASELRTIQSMKGATYVLVVTVAVFALTRALLGRLEARTVEVQREREALLSAERRMLAGTLAASIAHDVNNLVAVTQANIGFALEHEVADDVAAALEDANAANAELVALNRRLIATAKERTGEQKQQTSLHELVAKSLEMIRTHTRIAGCQVVTDLEPVEMMAFDGLVRHAVINLLLNAADATQGEGQIRVSVKSNPQEVLLCVEDNGPGFPGDLQHELPRPFFTTKDLGTGLGLFSVSYCAEEHDGSFEVGESELGGAKLLVRFPRQSG